MKQFCKHFYVSGKVQGVWFRAATQNKANELGLTGWVKNLQDGRVEAVACGDAKLVQEFEEWLWQGSDSAKVDHVESSVIAEEYVTTFEIR